MIVGRSQANRTHPSGCPERTASFDEKNGGASIDVSPLSFYGSRSGNDVVARGAAWLVFTVRYCQRHRKRHSHSQSHSHS